MTIRHDTTTSGALSPVRRLALCVGLGALIALAGMAAAPQVAQAQDEAQIKAGLRVFKARAQCFDCHGWAADGAANPRAPQGPSLRETQLDRAGMIEVVQCGRPGTGMPRHDRLAYDDDRCYGMTKSDIGDDLPPPGRSLRMVEIEQVVDYLLAWVVGRGEVIREECAYFWGATATICTRIPATVGN